MKCINCGEEIKKSDKYCPKCGEKTNTNKEDLLIKAYIGDGYEKIKEESFSISAFLLGPLYLFYRKLYAYGILSVLLVLLVLNLGIMSEISIILTCLVFYILFGIFFNKIYMMEVKKRVNNIKNRNEKASEEELIKLCKENGRTTIIAPIIYVLAIILGIGLIILNDDMYYIEPVATMYYLTYREDYGEEIDSYDYEEDFGCDKEEEEDLEEEEELEDEEEEQETEVECQSIDGEEVTDCIEPIEPEEPINRSDGSDRIVIQEDGE